MFKYCPQCSSILNYKILQGRERRVCRKCGYIRYRNPIPAVGAVIFDYGKILLIKRKFEPSKGDWALPSGFIEWGETAEDACIREVKEETGLAVKPEILLGVYRQVSHVYGELIVIVFSAIIIGGDLKAGDDAEDAEFFKIPDLPDLNHDCNVKPVKLFLSKHQKQTNYP